MTRKLRKSMQRAAAKQQSNVDTLKQAQKALADVGGLAGMIEAMREVHQQSTESHALLMALVEDYQILAYEVQAQRDVFLEVLASMSSQLSGMEVEQVKGQILGAYEARLEKLKAQASDVES